jgi:hypothetical protein
VEGKTVNCFYHPEVLAVGICKICGRGICKPCANELETWLVCRGRCELGAAASTQNAVKSRVRRRTYSSERWLTALVLFVFGVLMGAIGAVEIYRGGDETYAWTYIAMSFVFIPWGLLKIHIARKFKNID